MSFLNARYFFVLITMLATCLVAFGLMPPVELILVLIFVVLLLSYQYLLHKKKRTAFYICWPLAIVFGVVIGIYKPLGFIHPLVFSAEQLHANGMPFDLTVNVAKTLAGYCILCLMMPAVVKSPAIVTSSTWQYFLALLFAFCVLVAAYFCLNLHVYVKSLTYILTFLLVNLLATCIVEEAFMRLLLQEQIHRFMMQATQKKYWQEIVPLFISTTLFTLTHFSFNLQILLVFSLAGFLYGLIYTLTRNVAASITVHFIVNAVHFSLLTYPVR